MICRRRRLGFLRQHGLEMAAFKISDRLVAVLVAETLDDVAIG